MFESLAKVRTGKIYCPNCRTKLEDTSCPAHNYCPKCKKLINL